MNKLAIILSHLKENKAFYVILVLNFILSFGLLFLIQKADITECRKEIHNDLKKDHESIDSLQTDIETMSFSFRYSKKNETSNKGFTNLKCQYYEN